ncbi:alpha/beta fold hydrolase [Virgisporangium aurantiacum]|nr:alpha/beta fold hydrolase [Virgisporangium aurantiacum]
MQRRTRVRRGVSASLAMIATGTTWAVVGPGSASAIEPTAPTVTWVACPAYSDAVLDAVVPGRLEQTRALVQRMECGTVSVPMDYRDPGGRQITVAVTRIRATDQAHRLGSLAFNPGGPGGSGYLTPVRVAVANASTARLNERYDLIGFDPRGVGNSTKVTCAMPPPVVTPPGPLTEETARRLYDAAADANAACVRTDPAFLAQVNTPNVARDLDRVRAALGERRLSYVGVSWGTRLGLVYRTLFPAAVGRMFLDSVLPTWFVNDALDDGQAAAQERQFLRLAAWMAERNDVYGFGRTTDEVRAAVIDMQRDYDANPRTFTDLPMPLDAGLIAQAGSQLAVNWPMFAEVLAQLRDATGPTAPPAVRKLLLGGDPRPDVPADMPELYNKTMEQATVCGDDPARPDFTAVWATFQRRIADNPVAGRGLQMNLRCAGWSVPGHSFSARRTGAPVALAGHRHELVTPYEWALQAHAVAGGTLLTVDDDVHGSVYQAADCADDLLSYLTTGRLAPQCDGLQS